MAITSQQITSILSISGTYSLISGAATITDTTNWASIGVASPNTVKILLYIQDSGGNLFYKNAGYDSADYTNPDLQPLTSPASYSFTLPTDITGAFLTGQYIINEKIQVVQGSDTTEAYKALYQNIVATCNGIVPVVEGSVSYNTAVVSVTDLTNYKTWTALSNTIYLYPPPQTGQTAQHDTFGGSPPTLIYEPPMGQYPYTGVWTWTLSTELTYTDPLTSASTTCLIAAQGTFSVIQSQLCKVLCYLKKYRANVQVQAANSQTIGAIAKRNLLEAEGEYMLAFAAERCGRPQSEIDTYVAAVYALIGVTPDSECDCGCGDGVSQPLVPTSIINGADGTDGTIIYSGTGVPSGGLGVVGDFYIDTNSPYSFYKKTGATTWTFLFSTLGATGATGATGANGVSILANQYPDLATLGVAFESLLVGRVPYSLPANTLNTNLDEITIYGSLIGTENDDTKLVRIMFNGSSLILAPQVVGMFSNLTRIEFNARLTRVTNTTAKYTLQSTYYTSNGAIGGYTSTAVITQGEKALAGLNFTTDAYDIDIQGDSVVIGDITCKAFEVIYKHKV